MSEVVSLTPVLSGLTGIVKHVSPNGGHMACKSSLVIFHSQAIVMPEGAERPSDIMSCIHVGDTLHYDAVLNSNPIMPFYDATKVWFPKSKPKTRNGSPVVDESLAVPKKAPAATSKKESAATPKKEPAATPKMATKKKDVKKALKNIINVNGPVSMSNLYASMPQPEYRAHFENSIDGLRKFIISKPKDFLLVDNIVHVIPKTQKPGNKASTSTPKQPQSEGAKPSQTEDHLWGLELVTKSVKLIKKHLKSKGNMSCQQLYDHVVAGNSNVSQFIGTTVGSFRSFLDVHSDVFVVLPNDTVTLKETGVIDKRLEYATSSFLHSVLENNGPLSLVKLFEQLANAPAEVRTHVGPKPKSLKKFLHRHKEVFYVSPNDLVVLTRNVGSDANVVNSGTTPSTTGTDGNIEQDSVGFLKGILKAKGQMPIASLLSYVDNSRPEIQKHVGGSKTALVFYLLRHRDIFEFEGDEVRRIEDDQPRQRATSEQKPAPSAAQSMPCWYRGPVQHVTAVFGFIKHGITSRENIYFDLPSYMGVVDGVDQQKLTSFISIGDTVDCLYVPSSSGKHCDYRAVAIWKVPCETESNFVMVTPVTVLPSPVFCGTARISYLQNDVGYCMVNGSSFYDKASLVVFHTKHVADPQNHCGQLKIGNCIRFIAVSKTGGKDAATRPWTIVSLWAAEGGNQKSTTEEVPGGLFSVTARIREMTNDGGDLVFGTDSWAHRVSFTWEQVLGNLKVKAVIAATDSPFWCIVKNDIIMGVTKWVAVELIPYERSAEPPARFNSCLQVPLPTSSVFSRSSSLNSTDATRASPENVNGFPEPSPKRQVSGVGEGDPTLLLSFEDPCFADFLITDEDFSGEDLLVPNVEPQVRRVESIGTIVSKTFYGGLLESNNDGAVPFDAHSFYFNGKPISHMAFKEGTRVHFSATRTKNGLLATSVWVGKKPETSGSDSNGL